MGFICISSFGFAHKLSTKTLKVFNVFIAFLEELFYSCFSVYVVGTDDPLAPVREFYEFVARYSERFPSIVLLVLFYSVVEYSDFVS